MQGVRSPYLLSPEQASCGPFQAGPSFLSFPLPLRSYHAPYYMNQRNVETEGQTCPKPNHSYIGLIAMAILKAPERKLVLSDIYTWIADNFEYFRTRGPGWKNSIRHNLSLNDCFIKVGRCPNGKGHYWSVHPANVSDFMRGDFRRRRAQQKVRGHMSKRLSDEESDSDDDALPASDIKLPMTKLSDISLPALAASSRKRPFDIASLLGITEKQVKLNPNP